MLAHLYIACGRDGVCCGLRVGCVQHDQPAMRTAGWSSECPAGCLPLLLRGRRHSSAGGAFFGVDVIFLPGIGR
ncbi:hypothetical protein D7X33_10590 [Butyricicoccus sp. 1XD8-22]|nr:hypothetical protein D7X33_10590 [Butyricicoccus sp. 1XD8-22]